MPLLNFMKKFAPMVESGEKTHTIRKRRKDGRDPRKGQTLFLYTGLRSKVSRKIGETVCVKSFPIQIDQKNIVIGGWLLPEDEEEKLAKDDGFDSVTEFRQYFLKDHPLYGTGEEQFDGYLIHWGPITKDGEK